MSTQVREVSPWQSERLVCGIGHSYRGRVRTVEGERFDSDGERLWTPPYEEYDPDRCVVCGLLTVKVEKQ